MYWRERSADCTSRLQAGGKLSAESFLMDVNFRPGFVTRGLHSKRNVSLQDVRKRAWRRGAASGFVNLVRQWLNWNSLVLISAQTISSNPRRGFSVCLPRYATAI